MGKATKTPGAMFRESPRDRQDKRTEFRVHVVTWNVASAFPSPSDIESLFVPQESMRLRDLRNYTDLVVVGLQEAYQSVQDAVTSVVGRDPLVDAFSEYLAPIGFVRLAHCRLLGILLMVFVQRPLLCYIHDVETCSTKTGMGGWLGNKGAVSVRFTLRELSVCFTNCHLVPHLENNEKRVMELQDIIGMQVFENARLRFTKPMDHDVFVLLGDLNFRIEGLEYHEVVGELNQKKLNGLLKQDQLRLEQVKGESSPSFLYCFMEMSIDFPPSYKYEPGTDDFALGAKMRPPAWCDRVLWRVHERRFPKVSDLNPSLPVQKEYYGIHMQPKISDHKAVCAGLKFFVDLSDFYPRVVFHLSEWLCKSQATIAFDVMAGTTVSMWDWIGLYRAGFCSVERDHVLWVSSPAPRGRHDKDAVHSRMIQAEQVPSDTGLYILLYKSSHYGCVLGMSPAFPIKAP